MIVKTIRAAVFGAKSRAAHVGPALILAVFFTGCGSTDPETTESSMTDSKYPAAPRGEQVDDYHGVRIPDPYRWLEDLDSAGTGEWVEAQNALAKPFLEGVDAREDIKNRLTELWNYERFGIPVKEGGRYFFLKNDGLQDQSVLYVTENLQTEARVLLDPNTFSDDATVALSGFKVSPDGSKLAYSVSDGGTDWDIWRVREVVTGKDLDDEVRFTKFTDASWTPDSNGFYYSRYPEGPDGRGDDSRQVSIHYHRLGTAQYDDRVVYEITDHPTRNPYAVVTDDGGYLIIGVFDGYASNGIYVRSLESEDAEVIRLFDEWDALYTFLGNQGSLFFFHTTRDAPNGRVVAVNVDRSDSPTVVQVVPETEQTLVEASLVGDRIIGQYLEDARSVVRVYSKTGDPESVVELPGLGTVEGFDGHATDTETFFTYTDFTTPVAVYRYDIPKAESSLFQRADTAVDTGLFESKQVFFDSKDGTRVPMFIVHKKGLKLDGDNPTLLYGYGGFNIALTPEFRTDRLVWLELGGVLAIPNLRGGSEYGERWHLAGTKLDKQNVFDDFIAAAEWLIKSGYTSSEKLAIQGRSNGGLLVGAVMTQRPDLFAAALPAVGVLDMLRYHTASANARQWSSDYGLSENEKEFNALVAYSPYHKILPGLCYPPTLITTADHDDRVVPWHSYKFGAALQHAQGCDNPILVRIETRAGHGAGKPTWMQIEDVADQWAFLTETLAVR